MCGISVLFFFQAEDGIRDVAVTGVQTCALPISSSGGGGVRVSPRSEEPSALRSSVNAVLSKAEATALRASTNVWLFIEGEGGASASSAAPRKSPACASSSAPTLELATSANENREPRFFGAFVSGNCILGSSGWSCSKLFLSV